MKAIIIAAALLLTATAANAGDNSCRGAMVVGPEWTTITGDETSLLPKDHPRYVPATVCRFMTASPLGKRILRICPNGSQCTLSLSINSNAKDHKVDGHYVTIVRWPLDGVVREDVETVADKLCPDPSVRCKVRDNPEFYKDDDPALYKRITKPVKK